MGQCVDGAFPGGLCTPNLFEAAGVLAFAEHEFERCAQDRKHRRRDGTVFFGEAPSWRDGTQERENDMPS
jgi:hypothetical protein